MVSPFGSNIYPSHLYLCDCRIRASSSARILASRCQFTQPRRPASVPLFCTSLGRKTRAWRLGTGANSRGLLHDGLKKQCSISLNKTEEKSKALHNQNIATNVVFEGRTLCLAGCIYTVQLLLPVGQNHSVKCPINQIPGFFIDASIT